MAIKLYEVQMAKENHKFARKLYQAIFYDEKGNPKLRMWLKSRGVPDYHLEDVESEMRMAFVKCIYSYKHNKIYFEKYVWTEFSNCLINWFKSRTALKVKMLDVGLEDSNGNLIESKIGIDVGDISLMDFNLDFESIVSSLPSRAQTVARTLFYSGFNDYEIMRYFKMPKGEYESHLVVIKEVVQNYLEL